MTSAEILRIRTMRDTIRAKLVALGLADSSAKIDAIPNNGTSRQYKEGII